MKIQITESDPDSLELRRLRLYRFDNDPPDFWRTQSISTGDFAMPKVFKFWEDYITAQLPILNPDLGNNRPFGHSEVVLSNEPDVPPQTIDTYYRRYGTKNENFWERVRNGDIVVQDDFFVSQSVVFLNNVAVNSSPIVGGSHFHNIDQVSDKMYPSGTRMYNTDRGTLPCMIFDGDPYVMLLSRTGVRRYVRQGYEDIESTGYDKSKNFSYIEYCSSRDLDCDFYTEALAKANSDSFDLLTELAELPETVRYIIGRLKDFSKIMIEYQEVKKLRVTKLRKKRRRESNASYNKYVNQKSINDLTDASLSTWMEYRYAIMTLVYSLQDLHKYFLTINDVYKTSRSRKVYAAPDEWFYIPDGFTVERNSIVVNDRVWIKRKYDLSSLFDSLLKGLQTNLFKTAWELIPLSFVVDWFINIGDLIDSLLSYQPYLIERQTSSRQVSGTLKLRHQDGYSVEHQVKTYHRYLLKEQNISFLNIENGMDFVRTLDAIALTYKPVREKLASLRKTL